MDKSLDFIEIYTNLFSKALSSNEPSHYTIVLFSNTLIHQAIDTSHREENINLDILKNLAFTISKWIQAQNSKHIISLINFSDEIQDLIQGSELDLINIKNALRSPHPLSYNFLESKPHKGKANGADFLTKISEKLNGLQAKNKFLVVLTDQTMKFDEGQVDWLSEIARLLVIFYGSKNTPENLNKWCSENAVSPSEVIQFIEYDYLTAFTDFLSEEPKTSVSFTLKFVATTSALVQFEEKETKSLQYEIEWKSSIENQSSSQATTSWNHFIITGLTPNTEYNIRARVRTEFGHVSKWSKNSSFFTLKSHELENILRDTSSLEKKNAELLDSIRSHNEKLKELKIPGINLMVIGHKGVGKSNLITSLNMIFNKVFDESLAPIASNPEGTTETYSSARLLDYLRLWDCIGYDHQSVDLVDWLPSCLDGELTDGTKLIESVYKRQEPSIKTKMHGAILLVDDLILKDSLLLKKTLDVMTILTKRFIPYFIVLSKADQVVKSPLKPEELLSHPDILNTIKSVAQALKYSNKEALIYPVINYQYKPENNFLQFDYLMLRLLRELITNATKSVLSNKKIVEVVTTTKEKIGNLSLDSLNIKLEAAREMIHKMADDQFMFTRQDNFKISKKEEATLTVDDILQQTGDVLFIKINTHVKLD